MDSDDKIDDNMLELLISLIEENPHTDLAVCGYYIDDKPQIRRGEKKRKMGRLEAAKAAAGKNGSLMKGYVVNKLFKRDVIVRENLKFDENIYICEDLLFCQQYIWNCRYIYYTPEPKYHYITRAGSAMHGRVTENRMSVLNTFSAVIQMGRKYDDTELDSLLNASYWNHYVSILKDVVKHPSMEQKKYESDMSRKEKRELEKSYFRGMSVRQKAEHVIAYYKTHIMLLFLTLLVIIFGIYFVYRTQVDILLNVVFIDSMDGDQKTMESDFKEYMGDSSALHEIFVDDTILFTGSALSDSYKEIKLSSFIQNKLPDVMIMDEEYYGQYKESGMLQPFIKVMSEEEQESLGIRAEDGYGVMMTGNQKLEEYGFLIDGDSYLVVMQDAAHPEEAKDFIEFLCG